MLEDRELIYKIVSGETGLFREFIERHQGLVSHIVFRMISDPVEREDICQEVFIKAYANLANFRFDSKLSTWLGKIAYNTCLNHLSKKKVPLFDDCAPEGESIETQPGEDIPSPDGFASRTDISYILKKEIETLPIHQRTILTLYHIDGISYREIGEILELPDGTVKSYLFRARKSLKDRLEKKYRKEDLCG